VISNVALLAMSEFEILRGRPLSPASNPTSLRMTTKYIQETDKSALEKGALNTGNKPGLFGWLL